MLVGLLFLYILILRWYARSASNVFGEISSRRNWTVLKSEKTNCLHLPVNDQLSFAWASPGTNFGLGRSRASRRRLFIFRPWNSQLNGTSCYSRCQLDDWLSSWMNRPIYVFITPLCFTTVQFYSRTCLDVDNFTSLHTYYAICGGGNSVGVERLHKL